MSQELESAKYLQQASQAEMKAYEKRVTGSSNGRFAAKSMLFLLFWVVILGGGGLIVCNAIHQANEEKGYTGTGYGPAMSALSFCMHLVHWDWDDRVDEYAETVWPDDPLEDRGEIADDAGWRARREGWLQEKETQNHLDSLPRRGNLMRQPEANPIDPFHLPGSAP